MACKNCEVYQETQSALLERIEAERRLMAIERERADELQGACDRYKDEAAANLLEAGNWKKGLEEEQAKPAVSELLSIASTAAQIVGVLEKGTPVGVSAIDEAAEVALRALKQVRERLEEGAEDA